MQVQPEFWAEIDPTVVSLRQCRYCHGEGFVRGRGAERRPCDCVLRGIFYAATEYVREWWTGEIPDCSTRWTFGYRAKELRVDIDLAAKAVLGAADYRIFDLRFTLGLDWPACCRVLRMDRGAFWHRVYRIAAIVGAEIVERGIWPLGRYFRQQMPAESLLAATMSHRMGGVRAIRPLPGSVGGRGGS
jgi:hypothetical protein